MISEKFIKALPDDTIKGARYILNDYISVIEPSSSLTGEIDDYNAYIDFYTFCEAFLQKKKYKFDFLTLVSTKYQNIQLIRNFFSALDIEIKEKEDSQHIKDTRQKYGILFGNRFSYEFTDGDLNRIQELINELRKEITNSTFFSDEHKQRLLKKLEKMQSELNKKVSSLDSFWGLLGDAGVAIGKFGNDAKPFVDRIREIAEIGWRTQSRAEELPSGTKIPFLTNGTEG